jgi:hypothetical protein
LPDGKPPLPNEQDLRLWGIDRFEVREAVAIDDDRWRECMRGLPARPWHHLNVQIHRKFPSRTRSLVQATAVEVRSLGQRYPVEVAIADDPCKNTSGGARPHRS